MRVAQLASLGVMAAAAGLANAQVPPTLPPPNPVPPAVTQQQPAAPPPAVTQQQPAAPPPVVEQPPAPPAVAAQSSAAAAQPPGGTPATPPGTAQPTPPPGNTQPTPPPSNTQPTPPPPPPPSTNVLPPPGPTQPSTDQAPTPLPPPTPVQPPPSSEAAIPASHPMAPAWAGADPAPGGPFSDLAHMYMAPMRGPQHWAGVDYLLWFVKPAPLPIPLVNTTRAPEDLAANAAAGGVDDPLAVPLLGRKQLDFGARSGVRVWFGMWFDSCQETGIEVNAYYLSTQSQSFFAVGGTNGNTGGPNITVPFNSVGGQVLGETSAVIGGLFNGAIVTGTVTEHMRSQLWGSDADMLLNLWKCEFWRLDAIAGFKYAELNETLDFITSVRTAPFGSTADKFRTQNNFYGGEIGTRLIAQVDRWGFLLTGKVGLGEVEQTLDISGVSIAPQNFGGAVSPGGFFALASNIGESTRGRFGVIPQVNGRVTYAFNSHAQGYFGYDFMYWSHVLRPGNEIDRNINTNLSPVFGGNANGAGTLSPTRLNREMDFWAHGVTMGVTLSW